MVLPEQVQLVLTLVREKKPKMDESYLVVGLCDAVSVIHAV